LVCFLIWRNNKKTHCFGLLLMIGSLAFEAGLPSQEVPTGTCPPNVPVLVRPLYIHII
jgi:hypothetical protein